MSKQILIWTLLGSLALPAQAANPSPQRLLLICLNDQMPPLRTLGDQPRAAAARGQAALLLDQPTLTDADLDHLLALLGWAVPGFGLHSDTRGQVCADRSARRALFGQEWLPLVARQWLRRHGPATLEARVVAPPEWRIVVENLRRPPDGYAAIVYQAGDTWWRWLGDLRPEVGLAVRWFDDIRMLLVNRSVWRSAGPATVEDLLARVRPQQPLGCAIDPSVNRLWEFVGLLSRAGQDQLLTATKAEIDTPAAALVVDHLVDLRRQGLLRCYPSTEALYDALVAGEISACIAEPRAIYWLQNRFGEAWPQVFDIRRPYSLRADTPAPVFVGGHLLVVHPALAPEAKPLAQDLLRLLAGPSAPRADSTWGGAPHFPPYAAALQAVVGRFALREAEAVTPAQAAGNHLALVEDNPLVTDRMSRLWFNVSRVPTKTPDEPPPVALFSEQLRQDAQADLAAAQEAAQSQLGGAWGRWIGRFLAVLVLALAGALVLLISQGRRQAADLRLALRVLAAAQAGEQPRGAAQ